MGTHSAPPDEYLVFFLTLEEILGTLLSPPHPSYPGILPQHRLSPAQPHAGCTKMQFPRLSCLILLSGCLQRQHLSKTSRGMGLSLPQSRRFLSPGKRGARGGSGQPGWAQQARPMVPCEFRGNLLFYGTQSLFQAVPSPWLCVCTSPELGVSVPGC